MFKIFIRIILDNKKLVNLRGFLDDTYKDLPLPHLAVSLLNWSHWHALQYLCNSELSVTCCEPSDPKQTIKRDTRNGF